MIRVSKLIAGTFVQVGKTYLAGTVKVNGQPAAKRLMVTRRGSGEYIASTVSHIDGTWRIIFGSGYTFAARGLLVTYFDDTGEYNAEVNDLVTPLAWTGEG